MLSSTPTVSRRRRPTVLSLLGIAKADGGDDGDAATDGGGGGSAAAAANWAAQFDLARFSDIDVLFGGRTLKLHRIVLLQSPLFDALFSGKTSVASCSYELDVAGSTATLDLDEAGVNPESLQIALRDLYATTRRAELINSNNIFSVMLAACFLQTQELISFCTNTILTTLSKSTIATYCLHIDTIFGGNSRLINVSTNRDYIRLKNLARDALLPHIESFLCHTINFGVVTCLASAQSTASESASTRGITEDLFSLLSDLPQAWFKCIIESPMLAVPDEFSRYQLLKKAAAYRWRKATTGSATDDGIKRVSTIGNKKMTAFFGSLFSASSSSLPSSPSASNIKNLDTASIHSTRIPSSLRGSVASFESSVFGSICGGGQSHNHSGPPAPTSYLSRLVNLYGQEYLKTNELSAFRDEETLVLQMFETGIIYTYMSFAQLEKVKADRIVSDTAVLNSFWMQAELINRFTTPFQQIGSGGLSNGFPGVVGPFRFSVCLKGLYGFVMDNLEAVGKGEKCVVASEGVKCAGIDYRVLVAVEVNEKYEKKEMDDVAPRSGISKPPSLFQMNRSKSLDDLKAGKGVHGVGEYGIFQGVEDDLVSRKFVLKATLQRNRAHGMSGNSGSQQQRSANPTPPISYSIYLLDPSTFVNGVTLVQQPVTTCDFEGAGYVKGFAVPKSKSSNIGTSTEELGGKASGSNSSPVNHPKGLIGNSAPMNRTGSQTSIIHEKMKKMRDSFKIRSSGSCSARRHNTRSSGSASDGQEIWLTVNINLFSNE